MFLSLFLYVVLNTSLGMAFQAGQEGMIADQERSPLKTRVFDMEKIQEDIKRIKIVADMEELEKLEEEVALFYSQTDHFLNFGDPYTREHWALKEVCKAFRFQRKALSALEGNLLVVGCTVLYKDFQALKALRDLCRDLSEYYRCEALQFPYLQTDFTLHPIVARLKESVLERLAEIKNEIEKRFQKARQAGLLGRQDLLREINDCFEGEDLRFIDLDLAQAKKVLEA